MKYLSLLLASLTLATLTTTPAAIILGDGLSPTWELPNPEDAQDSDLHRWGRSEVELSLVGDNLQYCFTVSVLFSGTLDHDAAECDAAWVRVTTLAGQFYYFPKIESVEDGVATLVFGPIDLAGGLALTVGNDFQTDVRFDRITATPKGIIPVIPEPKAPLLLCGAIALLLGGRRKS